MIIHVNISEQCNLDCSFCYIHPKNKTILNVEAFLRWFERFQSKRKDNIVIRFFDGEPMLHVSSILEIIHNTTATYEICTNLVYEITSNISEVLNLCSVFTSWDPVELRFKTEKNFELWKNNCKQIKPDYVSTILTQEVLNLNPKRLFDDFESWNIKLVCFAHVDAEGKAFRWPIPKLEDIDDWLCNVYDIQSNVKVDIFEHYISACLYANLQTDKIKSKSQGVSSLTIKPAGEIFIDDSLERISLSIFDANCIILDNIDDCYHINKTFNSNCRVCDLHWCCLTDNRMRKLSKCTFPKKLFTKIEQEYSLNQKG